MTNQILSGEYESQLLEKYQQTLTEFAEFGVKEIEVFRSPVNSYRMRAEFRAWQEDDGVHYAMYQPGSRLAYKVGQFPAGSPAMQEIMPKLAQQLSGNELLRRRLYQIEFLTTMSGEVLVTLIYHKSLDDPWTKEAEELAKTLSIHVVGRSRNQKVIVTQDFVTEKFVVAGREYRYQQLEGSFTQPNGPVCQHMLNWAVENSRNFAGDLLELYCGNGNFTLPLSRNFNKVLATEVAKSGIQSALLNCEQNQIDNIAFARLSSEELCNALNGVRAFERLKHVTLSDYQFTTVFVDPPRAGLDPLTNQFIQRFDNIIYISCNPNTLKDNLKTLEQSHCVVKMALFDQFPYTEHRECGVILRKI
ncbi:tRNA (uridine(54)-C5)-methyltransferase TrmA [Saccharophagus sp. K07]|uniref:tRNA (uridine(54)-C5)-methyltransferase TrmA n=1 Tax=Saccharophagus sp. K07 TaxID=2283636 RepID=UPI0016529D6D|nr:tRNA (uridine(54)-C5)-methyltransferase TrmA [Saccharophagus sp. K07]MBC6906984.1 tRNA (uridine(54)-C5)-methyltransferase TrmA [Saccharophagus sp. K07]